MKRKDFFKGLAIGAIATPVAIRALTGSSLAQNNASANIITDRKYRWKMVTTWPPGFPVIGEACQLFADTVKAMSGGRMEIRVYGGGELVPALEVFDAVSGGTAEIGNGAAYYWAGKSPAAQFFASVPFGMNAQQLTSWVVAGGGQALWEALYRDFNLLPMLGGNTGVQMGGWFNREINSINDLRGLKMRIPGLGGDVLARAGGSPVLLAGGEIYTGLELGVIDATEWLGPFHDTLMGFQDIAKYYYTPGWHEPGTALEYIFNKKAFDALPADLQAILRSAALHSHVWMFAHMEAKNSETLVQLIEQGVDIRTFPEEVLAQLRVYTREVIEALTAKDAFTRQVYESYEGFRQKATHWARISEKQFYNNLET